MKKLGFCVALVVVGALAGCGASSDEGALEPGPPPGGVQLATPSYHVDSGQETYMCYQFRSPADAVAITHVDTISMPGIHHLALFQVMAGNDEPEEAHECNVTFKLSWLPVFVSGTGSKELTMPDGVGFKIAPNTQYVLQLHIQNASDEPMDVRAGVNLTYDHNPDALQPAGIYALGHMQISIPPNTTDYSLTETCKSNKTRNVFAVFPHMHKLGTAMDVMYTPSGGAASSFYSVSPWSFGNQPVEPRVQTLAPNDELTATCHWNNPGASPVTYGESSDNEMCFFVMFYYPFDQLDGCID
jgi:hypothetical protein